MASKMGNCAFKCGYTLYADTCIGRWIHNRYIRAFQKEFGENAIHSQLTPFTYNDLLILPIPLLTSNYAYLVADVSSTTFVLIDVGDSTIIQKIIYKPEAILTTHKHWDHSGGNRTMRATIPKLKVYGGVLEHVPDSTHSVSDGDILTFGRLKFTAIWTPGHTKGHIVWRLHGDVFETADSVFTGDHLMLAGCGAAFEGTVKQLIDSLNIMKKLPDNTRVWPGHEAALDNLQLVCYIDPGNTVAMLKLNWALDQREQLLCTCPSTIEEEKKYNPFLRTDDEVLWKTLGIDKIIKDKPIPQEIIGPYCFDCIITKAVELRRIRHIIDREHKNCQNEVTSNEQKVKQNMIKSQLAS